MKRIATLFLVGLGLFSAVNVFAQEPASLECKQYQSFYYNDHYKQKDYEGALPTWRKAYELCPRTFSSNLYLHGETIIRFFLDNNKVSDAERAGMVDTLMRLFDERSANFPKTRVAQMNRKGADAELYIKNDLSRKYAIFEQVLATNKDNTDPQIVYFLMDGTLSFYKDGAFDAEKVISTYDNLITSLDGIEATAKNELAALAPDAKDYDKAVAAVEKVAKTRKDVEELFIISRVASCENLVELFTPRYEANPNDIDLIEKIVGMLDNADDCNNNDLYFKTATALYAAKPSYKAAYSLFRLNAARDNVDEAIKYLEEAIASDESEVEKDVRMYYDLARFCNAKNRNGKALSAANRVIQLESGMEEKTYSGKANMIIGRIWAGTSCGGNEIDNAAKYWVAVDYLQRARALDPDIASECGNLIAAYSSRFPLATAAADYDIMNGQSYTVSCGGMTATTTVRTRL